MTGSHRIKELFNELIELPEQARQARLLEQSGRDTALRERVEALLRAHETARGMFADPTFDAGPEPGNVPSDLDSVGDRIGPYHLLERIGEGGFGTVYMAEQREPVQRRVALKLIKPGMDTRQVIARFEAERQALARMDHPHIARVLDAGATDASSALGPGRPYFVMELVKGVPITQYCDEHELALRERLALFVDACNAVQHAHQKGVIHRDLKPSNVLVTRFDERAVVKIIDFGIAKATSGRLTEKTLFTEFRQLIGTPAYMSPEQAGLSDLDVDTRSDIYSLSVLLYELLTGTTPFDAERLRSAGFDELRRIICEEEPPKPSTRVSAVGPVPRPAEELQRTGSRAANSQEVALRRRTDPRSLARSVEGELDWIVMKGLEKDRTRRYETASALALDVERYLRHEPVLASPPSQLYRLRKLVRRNRAAVATGSLVTAALLAGIAGTTFGLLRAERRWNEAETARELAEDRERQTQQVAEFQAAMLSDIDLADIGNGIYGDFRDRLRSGLEHELIGELPDRRLRTPEEVETELAAFDQRIGAVEAVDVARRVFENAVLTRAAEQLEHRFAGQPLVEAQLRFALGWTCKSLGSYEAAESHLRAALEIWRQHAQQDGADPRIADCLMRLGNVAVEVGRQPEAAEHFRDAAAIWRALGVAPRTAVALREQGTALMAQRRLDEAEPLLEEAVRIQREHCTEDDLELTGTLNAMVILLSRKGQHTEAEALASQVLEQRRRQYGARDPRIVPALFNHAQELGHLGRHDKAESSFRDALDIQSAALGNEHILVAKIQCNLGIQIAEQGRGRTAEAIELYQEALAQQRKLRADHRELRWTLNSLSGLLRKEGDIEGAIELRRESLDLAEQDYPDQHPEAWRRFAEMSQLGGLLATCSRSLHASDHERALTLFEEAEPLILESIRRSATNMPPDATPEDVERSRQSLDWCIGIFEFWEGAAPGRGFGDRAAELKAERPRDSGT